MANADYFHQSQETEGFVGHNLDSEPRNQAAPLQQHQATEISGYQSQSPSSTVGIIKMKGDGTYTFGQNGGTYTVQGRTVTFSGIPWDNGRATLSNDTLEFYWKTAAGATQYFAFAKY